MMTFLMEISVPLTSFLLLWSLFDVPVVKSDTVTFSISSSAKIGDSAQFFCNATTTAVQYIANFEHNNNDRARVFFPGVPGDSDPNTSVTGSRNQSCYKYTISSLLCSDRGNYSCKVVSEDGGLESNTVTLDVLGPAGTPSLKPLSDNQILNDSLTVSCESNVGSPAQELKLCVGSNCATPNPPVKQDDQCTFRQTANLAFQVTKATMEATCRVGTSSLEVKQTWQVDYPVDAIRLIPDVREWRLVRGTKKTFRCVALGNPDPTIIWEFFPQASQTSRISWGRTIKLDPDTSGVYVCTANNTVGGISYKLTKTLTVTVYPVDAIRLIPDVREWRLVRGTKKTFDCVTLGNPEPTIMWEFFPQASQTSKISWGRSIELDPDTSGVYVCTANNTVGGISNKLTKTLTVTVYDLRTKPMPPTMIEELSTCKPNPRTTTEKAVASAASVTETLNIMITSVISTLIILIVVTVFAIILYKYRARPAKIQKPRRAPQNNRRQVNMMNGKLGHAHLQGTPKNIQMYNNAFDC